MKLETGVKLFIVLLGVATFGYLISLNLPKSQSKGVVAIGMIGVAVLWWVASIFFNRARLNALTQTLAQRGFTVGNPSEAMFIHTLERGQRALTSKFCARGLVAGDPIDIAEFTYMIGHGKHTRTICNMQVSRPCPGRWPDLRLSRRPGFLSRPISKLNATDAYGLESEAFAKRWEINCSDKDFAVLLLSPAAQDWLMLAPKDEYWTIVQGRICVTRQRKCSASETESLINRLNEFITMLPQELAAW